jgi:glycosyltransferase involved in cell wall biosynthesis
MKILIAIGVRRVREAGAAGVAFNHAAELERLGHNVDLWFLDDVLQPPRWLSRLEQLEFATVVSRRIRSNPKQYDVVDIHAPSGCVYGISRKLFPSAELPPYVFTMQGSEERYALAMRIEHGKGRATNFALKNRLWHRLYHQTMYDFSVLTADFGAVADREGWIHSELKYGRASGHIWYVPNGTNSEFFLPREFCEKEAQRLLYVGTWLDRKGIYYLAEAFSTVAPRLPRLTLTVAGCLVSGEKVKAFFPAEFRHRILVEPHLSVNAMPGLYAAHDVFVFPSLVEGMPLTLLEAMATAMPLVTTSTCGMADLVENEFNGLLVPAADSSALASAVERLCEDVCLREKLGLAAQETARRYNWRAIAKHLEHVLMLAVRARKHTVSE